MRKIDDALIREARDFVYGIIHKYLPEKYVYHTTDHTELVLRNAEEIGKNEGMTVDELNMVRMAALFHDIGYVRTRDDHESVSTEYAREFLRNKGVDPEQIVTVTRAISATRVPQEPTDKVSEVLCDADLMHLADKDYFNSIHLMKEEWENVENKRMSERDFHARSLKFFRTHRYHTGYGRVVLQPLKENNERKIERILADEAVVKIQQG